MQTAATGGAAAVGGGVVLVSVGAGAAAEGDAGAFDLAGGVVAVGFRLAVSRDAGAATVGAELVGGGIQCWTARRDSPYRSQAACVVVGAGGGEKVAVLNLGLVELVSAVVGVGGHGWCGIGGEFLQQVTLIVGVVNDASVRAKVARELAVGVVEESDGMGAGEAGEGLGFGGFPSRRVVVLFSWEFTI